MNASAIVHDSSQVPSLELHDDQANSQHVEQNEFMHDDEDEDEDEDSGAETYRSANQTPSNSQDDLIE